MVSILKGWSVGSGIYCGSPTVYALVLLCL